MTTPTQRVPALRFPEFSGEWKSDKLDSITSKISDGIHSTPIYDSDGEYYFINGNNLVNGGGVELKNSKTVSAHQWNIHKRPLGPDTILLSINGTIGVVALYDGEPVVLGKSACFINVDLQVDRDYIFQLIQSGKVQRYFTSELTGTTIKNLSLKTIKKTYICYPDLREQQKVASFLSSVDTKIEQLTKKKEKLEKYKKGAMQKLFSQEIRFKDDDGKEYPEWEEKRLGDVLDYEQPTKYLVESADYMDEHETPVLTAGKTFVLGYTDEQDGIFEKNLPTIIFDDFTTAFKYVDFPFKAKSSAMKMLIVKKDDMNIKYIYEAMKCIEFPLGEHKRHWISEYQEELINYPSLPEQQKIADFLSSIDDKIGKVGEELEKAKSFKKGLLQQMFV